MGSLITLDVEAIITQTVSTLKKFPYVAGAYLFGSALDKCRPDSDIDIGIVLLNTKISDRERAQLEADIANSLHSFKGHLFDVVLLNPEDPIFSFRVIKEGRLIYAPDMDRVTDFMEFVSRQYAEVYPRYKMALQEIIDEVFSGGNSV